VPNAALGKTLRPPYAARFFARRNASGRSHTNIPSNASSRPDSVAGSSNCGDQTSGSHYHLVKSQSSMTAANDTTPALSEEDIFRRFDLERLLDEGKPLHLTNADPLTKTVTLLGKISGQHAILSLEKTAFDVSNDTLAAIVSRDMSPSVSVVQRNDIYRWYLASMAAGKFGMKATIIYPATETHVRKHEKQRRRMVRETPEIYKDHIES
jgi:Scavenger mRNA decapping enzyme (DcpS) N-terminal